MSQHLEEGLTAGRKWVGNDDLVFTSKIGVLFDPRTVNQHLDKILDDGKLPHFTPHTARHYAASILLAKGVPLKVLSEILGHTSIRITANIYAGVLPSLMQDALDVINRTFASKGRVSGPARPFLKGSGWGGGYGRQR